MKPLVVTQYFAPENFRTNDLVAGMVARGHEVRVVTGKPNYASGQFFEGHGWTGPRHEERFGARIIRVPLIPRGSASGARLALNCLSFVNTGCWGALAWLRGPLDAIFVFEVSPATVGIPAVLVKWKFRVTLFFWVLDLWLETLEATGAVKSRRLIRLMGLMVSWIYRRCDRLLVSSRAFAPAVESAGAKPESICYFRNWVEDIYQTPP
jgi:colanic acid biosynthesis glycosyl transferase WcaI